MASPGIAYFIGADAGQGAKVAWCVGLHTGFSVLADSSETRHNETTYLHQVTGSGFAVDLKFPSYKLWNEFNLWMMDHGLNASEGAGPMTVSIPDRKFLRQGIATRGGQFGDEAKATVRDMTIEFEGITDLAAPGEAGTSSEPWLPKDSTVRQFYPTGHQASAADRLESAMYDLEAIDPAALTGTAGRAVQESLLELQRRGGTG